MPDGGRLTVETANLALDRRAACERDLPPGMHVTTKPFALETLASRMRELIAAP